MVKNPERWLKPTTFDKFGQNHGYSILVLYTKYVLARIILGIIIINEFITDMNSYRNIAYSIVDHVTARHRLAICNVSNKYDTGAIWSHKTHTR